MCTATITEAEPTGQHAPKVSPLSCGLHDGIVRQARFLKFHRCHLILRLVTLAFRDGRHHCCLACVHLLDFMPLGELERYQKRTSQNWANVLGMLAMVF
eukprot:SAG31_NODE_255_length_19039_cov_83.461774_3_plen_99_part_00